jgi:cytochrome oxidase assembly protein ShyY1
LKRWINWIALVVIFSVACGFLANWQFQRRNHRVASIAIVKENYNEPAIDLEKLVQSEGLIEPSVIWRTARIVGRYLPEDFVLVRNRPNDGQPGFEQLVPFECEDGTVIFITRGWLPNGNTQDYPDENPLPGSQRLTVLARILPEEPILNRGAPKGQIASINIELANEATGLKSRFSNGYFRMVSEQPSQGESLKPMPAPTIEEGNNLSYAFQWILFALMATIALIWRIRLDAKESRGMPRKKRLKRSDLDAAFEDETTTEK